MLRCMGFSWRKVEQGARSHSSIPLLCVFAVAMRQFISGLTSGSIKA